MIGFDKPRRVSRITILEPKSPGVHIFSRFGMPRIGAVLLGTIMRDLGYDVSVQVEEGKPFDWDRILASDLVGISCITATATNGYSIADRVRTYGIPVVMGGPHPTHRSEEALEHADFVVRGEGEVALPELVRAIEKGEGFESIAGLSFFDDEQIVHVPETTRIADLDRWPDPDFSLVDGSMAPSLFNTKNIVPLMTSRGCPYDCSFCTVTTTFGRKMRYRSVERVIGEMSKHDPRSTHFFIYDDNFTANKRRCREFLEAFESIPGGPPAWSAQVRADTAKDEDLLRRMRKAGCDIVYIGLESVNDDTLQSANKRQKLSDVSTYLKRFRATGIEVHGMFVLGFDTDGPGTMERTVKFAHDHDLFSVQLLILTPLPGSRLAQELEDSGRVLHHDWSKYDAHHVCIQPKRVTPVELQRWNMIGHKQFYNSKRALWQMMKLDWYGVVVSVYAKTLQYRWDMDNIEYMRLLNSYSSRSLLHARTTSASTEALSEA